MKKNYEMKNKMNRAVCILLAFAGTWRLSFMLNLKANSLAVSNSYFGVFIFAVTAFLLLYTLPKTVWTDKRGMAAAGIIAGLFSVCIAFGVQLEAGENVNFRSKGMWAAVFIWTVILTFWIHRAWELLAARQTEGVSVTDMAPEALKGTGEESMVLRKIVRSAYTKWNSLTSKKQAVCMICFFILCWIPVFLAVYPGFFVYDAQDEFIQVQTRSFTTHHPLPHVLLLGGIILAGHKLTGSYNIGIALYTLFQMLLMAGVFTYVLLFMKRKKVQRLIRVLTAAYFGFFPVIVMFSLCSAKDGIFTAALLLLVLFMTDMAAEKEVFFSSALKKMSFLACAVIMMSFRHNGMYAFLVMTPILLVCMKGYRKKLSVWLGGAFILYFVLTLGLAFLLSAESSENQEMLTVPIQQLARTYQYDRESFTDEDRETLYEILPEDVLPFYTAKVSDGIKIWFNNGNYRADPQKYRKLWGKIGIKHPFTYLNAWFMTSYGFWYPDTVIDVYRGNRVFTFAYEDSSFFGYEVEQPGVRESKIPWLDELYRKMSLEITQQKIPVVSMLFSPGFLFWVYVFAGGYAYYRRKLHLLLPLCMILLVWLTVILGPTYLPRYVLILWFALPLVAALLVNRRQLCYT